MDTYEKRNTDLRQRRVDIFRNKTFKYYASDELVRSMRYEFVDDLVVGDRFTNLEAEWRTKVSVTLKTAEKLTFKSIQLLRINKPFSKKRQAMFRVRIRGSKKTEDKWSYRLQN